MSSIVVASWNVHAGVDGWGRPFDVTEGCRALGADVLVLQETWTPDIGSSLTQTVAGSLGYSVFEEKLVRAKVLVPGGAPGSKRGRGRKWGPKWWTGTSQGLYVTPSAASGETQNTQWAGAFQYGLIGIALLSRADVVKHETWELRSDPSGVNRRAAISLEISLDDGAGLRVIGTHLGHVRHGSILQLARLRRRLNDDSPTVLAGDMNMPRSPMRIQLPGWRLAVRGNTWPAWRPVVQSDYIAIKGPVEVSDVDVVAVPGSDHLPVRCTLNVT